MALTVDILWQAVLALCLILGTVLAVLQLPGTWFILLTTMAYAWHYQWQRITWWALGLMAAVALIAEVVDTLAGSAGARRAGATPAASWGALIGGFCGMIVLTPLIPIVGSIIGALLGCFAGAFIAEHNAHRDLRKGAAVGWGAARGRLLGLMVKMLGAFVMSAVAAGAALF